MTFTTEKYINPLTDFGFKKLFGSEPNKELLIHFLNELLPDRKIKDLTYTTSEQQGHSQLERKAIFDLHCVGDNDEIFIVEMQKAKQNYFKDRSVFYASFPIQQQGQKRDWNFRLTPVYFVGILDFIFEDHKNESELLHVVELKNQNCEVFYDKLKFVYLELPKFTKQEKDLKNNFDKWLYVFTHLSQLQERPKKLQDRVFKNLFETAEIAKFSPEERTDYEDSLKHYRDINNIVDTSIKEGIQKGRKEGRKEGKKEGRKEGKKEGRKEKGIEIAKQMKKEGYSLDQISKLTGLSEDFLKSI